MDERSSTQPFPNLHSHRHRSSYPLSLQSPEAGYLSSQSALDCLEQYGNRGEDSTSSFPASNASSGGRKGSGGGDRGFLNPSGSGMDVDASLGGHLDGTSRLGNHFADTWYSSSKKEDAWEDGESCESSADDFYSKSECYGNMSDLFHTMNCVSEEGVRCKLRSNYSNNYTQANCEARSEAVYSREANISLFTKQSSSYNRSAGSFSDSSADYCRPDSKVTDGYLGREEDYGSSCGSGEDQLPSADVEGPWISASPLIQAGEGRWRGAADTITLTQGCLPQRSPVSISSGAYTQKLDSFSEAFLSQRKRRFPVIPSGDSSGQMWEFGVGRGEGPGLVKSRHSCAFDSDPYLPPSSSSSSSPAHPSLPPFPSPPTSSHLVSSVLSPPPTPLPPPSSSPSKMDSSSVFGGTGHSTAQGAESLSTLQFFATRLQPLPSVHNPSVLWKIPMLSHCFPQSSGDPSNNEGNLRSPHSGDYGNITAPHETLNSPELSFLATLTHRPSTHTSRALCPLKAASIHPSLHLSSRPSHLSGQNYDEEEKTASYFAAQKVKNGLGSKNQLQLQKQSLPAYTGTPFSSVLCSGRGKKRGHYTPLPLLNPSRRGAGLYSSISSPHPREEEETEECGVLPHLNVGYEFQAELPSCFVNAKKSGVGSEEDSPREQLLWKPLDKLEDNANLQDQVQKLLSMCNSSCLPGGGSNTELALHCLHYCQGNLMASLEMLLFSQPSPTGDYHYSGSDYWTDTEKNAFSAALGTHGKDFSLIQKMVGTKSTRQCVEFYYLSKKILDKQKKLEEQESRDGELEQQKSVTPICQPVERQFRPEEAVPVPSLASFFPCKLCGKMFYKIKSRNAHMKIHRQPQEDWTDRQLQHQLLSQRLALSHSTNLIPNAGSNLLSPQGPALTFPPSGLTGTLSNKSNADSDPNSVTNSNAITPRNVGVLDPSTAITYSSIVSSDSHVTTHIDAVESNQREPTPVLPFHQSWGSFGPSPDAGAYYCNTDGKEHVEAGPAVVKEPMHWN